MFGRSNLKLDKHIERFVVKFLLTCFSSLLVHFLVCGRQFLMVPFSLLFFLISKKICTINSIKVHWKKEEEIQPTIKHWSKS